MGTGPARQVDEEVGQDRNSSARSPPGAKQGKDVVAEDAGPLEPKAHVSPLPYPCRPSPPFPLRIVSSCRSHAIVFLRKDDPLSMVSGARAYQQRRDMKREQFDRKRRDERLSLPIPSPKERLDEGQTNSPGDPCGAPLLLLSPLGRGRFCHVRVDCCRACGIRGSTGQAGGAEGCRQERKGGESEEKKCETTQWQRKRGGLRRGPSRG